MKQLKQKSFNQPNQVRRQRVIPQFSPNLFDSNLNDNNQSDQQTFQFRHHNPYCQDEEEKFSIQDESLQERNLVKKNSKNGKRLKRKTSIHQSEGSYLELTQDQPPKVSRFDDSSILSVTNTTKIFLENTSENLLEEMISHQDYLKKEPHNQKIRKGNDELFKNEEDDISDIILSQKQLVKAKANNQQYQDNIEGNYSTSKRFSLLKLPSQIQKKGRESQKLSDEMILQKEEESRSPYRKRQSAKLDDIIGRISQQLSVGDSKRGNIISNERLKSQASNVSNFSARNSKRSPGFDQSSQLSRQNTLMNGNSKEKISKLRRSDQPINRRMIDQLLKQGVASRIDQENSLSKVQQIKEKILKQKVFKTRLCERLIKFIGDYLKKRRREKRQKAKMIRQKKRQRTQELWDNLRKFVFNEILKKKYHTQFVSQMTNTSLKYQMALNADEDESTSCKIYIWNDNPYLRRFKMLVYIATIVSFFLIPLNFCTRFACMDDLIAADTIIDVILLIDIILNFLTINSSHPRLISTFKRYIKSFFLVDIVGCIFTLVFWGQDSYPDQMYLYNLKFFRILRLKRIFSFFDVLNSVVLMIQYINTYYKVQYLKLSYLLKVLLIYFLLFHCFSLIWIYIEYREDGILIRDGWLSEYIKGDLTRDNYATVYRKSFYFVVTNFATVGYGDLKATNDTEMVANIILILVVQLLFSFFMETFRKALLSENKIASSMNAFKVEKQEQIELLMMKISKTKGAKFVKRDEVKFSMTFMEAKLKYDLSSIRKLEYYKELNHHCKKKLIFSVFGTQILKLSYIFEDKDEEYKASNHFIYGIMKNLKCAIYTSEDIIVKAGDRFEDIFFIMHGGVQIYDKSDTYLNCYEGRGYFGDYQVILKLKSQFSYRALKTKMNYYMSIKGEKFLKYLSRDQDAQAYLSNLACIRRVYLRQIARESQQIMKSTKFRKINQFRSESYTKLQSELLRGRESNRMRAQQNEDHDFRENMRKNQDRIIKKKSNSQGISVRLLIAQPQLKRQELQQFDKKENYKRRYSHHLKISDSYENENFSSSSFQSESFRSSENMFESSNSDAESLEDLSEDEKTEDFIHLQYSKMMNLIKYANELILQKQNQMLNSNEKLQKIKQSIQDVQIQIFQNLHPEYFPSDEAFQIDKSGCLNYQQLLHQIREQKNFDDTTNEFSRIKQISKMKTKNQVSDELKHIQEENIHTFRIRPILIEQVDKDLEDEGVKLTSFKGKNDSQMAAEPENIQVINNQKREELSSPPVFFNQDSFKLSNNEMAHHDESNRNKKISQNKDDISFFNSQDINMTESLGFKNIKIKPNKTSFKLQNQKEERPADKISMGNNKEERKQLTQEQRKKIFNLREILGSLTIDKQDL